MISIFFGLLAAASWGSGDFTGGLSSRRIGAYLTVFLSEVLGLVFLLAALPVAGEPLPSTSVLLSCAFAGAIGSFGLVLLYRAMEHGQMSIATPISAVLAAATPILIGALSEGPPDLLQAAGFAFALAAIWLITQDGSSSKLHLERLSDLRLPFLAGLGFGTYFVVIHHAAQEAVLWPMIASRSGGGLILLALMLLRRQGMWAPARAWPLIAANAVLDVGGNLCFILAGQAGRMDVAAVISSLYPGGTVFLAWLLLKERISRTQLLGILAALVAIALQST